MMPMDVCHILLGGPWKYDINAIHEGKRNAYKFQKDGLNQTLLPLQEVETAGNNDPKALLMSGKEFLQQMEDNEVNFALVCKPRVVFTTNKISDLPIEIQYMLNKFHDLVVNDLSSELPPKRSISHHNDLIPGSNLPNKDAFRMKP